jgi:cell division protein FtsL
MADYNRSEAYDLSLYSMPALKPTAEPEIRRTAPKPAQKSAIQIRRETMASALRAVKLFFVSAVLLVLFGSVLFSKISLVRLEKEATMLQQSISEAQSENTRLMMQLNSAVSIEKVDAYAVSVLGMHKLERYQIHYFENRDGDKVVVAGGRAVKEAEKTAD